MDISKCTSYFHDGILIGLKQYSNKIDLILSSAEVDPEELIENIPLGKYDRIKGILHLEGIKKIMRNDQPFLFNLVMEHKRGRIFNFEINNHNVELQIDWRDSNPKTKVNDFLTILIEAEKIYWENKPDLIDPYW